MGETYSGSCFCGAVEIEAAGAPLEMGYCHCNSCRTYSGAPMAAFALWPNEQVRVTRGASGLGLFQKSPMSVRRFCTTCGGHVMVAHPDLGVTSVVAGVLKDLAFAPEVHLNYAETVLRVRDGLPKLKGFPVAAGGCGQTLPE